jgi:hypothetical protein
MMPCGGKPWRPDTWRGVALALAVLLGGPLRSQEGFSSIRVGLDPESRNVFWIDANGAVIFTLSAERRDLRLVFRDPKGLVWELAAPTVEVEPPSPRTVYGTRIEQPTAGAWTLTVSASEPLLDYPTARLRVDYANPVHARIALPKGTFLSGEPVPISLELLEGTTRVKGLRTTVTLTRLVDPAVLPTLVSFQDDGTHGDRIARDGLYTATIPAETPGKYHLEAQVEGSASTGHCHRTAEAIFKVVPKAARFTGNLTQRIWVGTPE